MCLKTLFLIIIIVYYGYDKVIGNDLYLRCVRVDCGGNRASVPFACNRLRRGHGGLHFHFAYRRQPACQRIRAIDKDCRKGRDGRRNAILSARKLLLQSGKARLRLRPHRLRRRQTVCRIRRNRRFLHNPCERTSRRRACTGHAQHHPDFARRRVRFRENGVYVHGGDNLRKLGLHAQVHRLRRRQQGYVLGAKRRRYRLRFHRGIQLQRLYGALPLRNGGAQSLPPTG